MVPEILPDTKELRRTERSHAFEEGRILRKMMGAFRYGQLGVKGKPKFDRVSDMIRRLQEYQSDRNKEHLFDVANLSELEFVEGDGVLVSKADGEHTPER